MIKEVEVKEYFQSIDKVLDKVNDLRKAWKYLVKKLKLSHNDATDVMFMYMQNRNDASVDNGLTM